MTPYCSTIEWGTPNYDQAIALRDEVLRRPLGLDFSAKDLALEHADIHLACFHPLGSMLGCMVLTDQGHNQLKMRQVAVAPSHQKSGIGSFLVAESERLAAALGYEEMVLNARDAAVPFYTKLRYEKAGKPFTEVGIKHFKMTKNLHPKTPK